MLNSMADINICTIHPHIQRKQNDLLYLAIFFVWVEFFLVEMIFKIIVSEWYNSFSRESNLKESLNNKMKKKFFSANLRNKKCEKGVPF